ncbi:DUF2269 family protein [Halalkalibacter kiskunsagensis]|uniref:DUF2269 family protein n=1 Tax=Halalkalibacter kiskunsagensis TaxID=1548599 RepID=A0ABV6KJT0_9BACI
MTLYEIFVLIHVISAVVGLGASFALPSIINSPQTAKDARYSLLLNAKVDVFAKVGSITLLVTGMILGVLNTTLFTTGWYLTSIAIYIGVQFIVAGVMPRTIKSMERSLIDYNDEDLPAGYAKGVSKLKPYTAIVHAAAVILIILMVIKPF